MRYFILFLSLFFMQRIAAQDKQLLKKQLMQLLVAYPGKFRSIKQDGLEYKFPFTGASSNPFKQMRDDTSTVSMAIMLPSIQSLTEATAYFDKWVAMLDEIDFNGAKTKATTCPGDQFVVRCRIWRLDKETHSIDPKYANFTISLRMMKVGTSYHPTIAVGDK